MTRAVDAAEEAPNLIEPDGAALQPREDEETVMAAHPDSRHVEIAEDGETVARAEVRALEDKDVVHADLHIEAGPIPSGTGRRLVDAVLDLPETRDSAKLEATLQMGDCESLGRLRECCEEVHAHPAGSTCLVDAVLGEGQEEGPARGR
jgi:hypothetical protein